MCTLQNWTCSKFVKSCVTYAGGLMTCLCNKHGFAELRCVPLCLCYPGSKLYLESSSDIHVYRGGAKLLIISITEQYAYMQMNAYNKTKSNWILRYSKIIDHLTYNALIRKWNKRSWAGADTRACLGAKHNSKFSLIILVFQVCLEKFYGIGSSKSLGWKKFLRTSKYVWEQYPCKIPSYQSIFCARGLWSNSNQGCT